MIAVKDRKSVSFLKLEPFIPTGSTNDFLLFDPFIVSVFVQHVRTKAVTSHLFTPLFMFIHLPLIHFAPPPRLLIDFKNRFAIFYRIPCYLLFKNRLTYFCILLRIIMHLLLFLSSDWLVFCHMIISLIYIYIYSVFYLFSRFLSDELKGQRSKR